MSNSHFHDIQCISAIKRELTLHQSVGVSANDTFTIYCLLSMYVNSDSSPPPPQDANPFSHPAQLLTSSSVLDHHWKISHMRFSFRLDNLVTSMRTSRRLLSKLFPCSACWSWWNRMVFPGAIWLQRNIHRANTFHVIWSTEQIRKTVRFLAHKSREQQIFVLDTEPCLFLVEQRRSPHLHDMD